MVKIIDDGKALEYLWFNGKKYTMRITDGTNNIDFNDLGSTWKKLIEDRDDDCKKITQLGGGLTIDRDMANGFLLGWLVKSIKDNFEKTNDCKLAIQVEEEEVSKDEIKGYLVDSLRSLADKVEKSDEDIKKAPVVRGDAAGLDLF